MPAHPLQNAISIEPLKAHEVITAIEWAQKEGWNPGLHDANCFFQADPKGFYAAKLCGEIVGTVSAVKYSDDFAFEGLLIVKPEHRGKGIGIALQNFVNNTHKGFTIGLDGVLEMQDRYKQANFNFAHKNTRYTGKPPKNNSSPNCVAITQNDIADIVCFDAPIFSVPRPNFLKCWLSQNNSTALMTKNKQTSTINGYGVIRQCFQGHKIGPLFAENFEIAEELFLALCATVPEEQVFLDVPEPNNQAVRLAQKYNLQPIFSTVRMYTKTAPNLPLDKIYGITSFELG